ncbi:unnamed protein product [Moneuplotes crassus]|nr:unnamed protein product [Moneuplotes crassus]
MYGNNYFSRGGGNFHGPSIPMQKEYIHHRRISLEFTTTNFFHPVAPEYVVNLHSLEYEGPFAGFRRTFGTFILAIPIFLFGMWVANRIGSVMTPTIRDTPDQAHKLPGMLRYLKRKDFNNAPDFLGRHNASFYRNLYPENLDESNTFLDLVRRNGVNF